MEQIAKIETRLDAVECDLKRNSEQHREFYDKLQNNAVNAKEMEVNLKYLTDGIADIQKTLAVMNSKEGQTWSNIKSDTIKIALTVIVTAVTVGILSIIKIKG